MKLKHITVELPGNPSPSLLSLLQELLARAETLHTNESLRELTVAVLSAGGKLYAKNARGGVLLVSLCAACNHVQLCGRCAKGGANQQVASGLAALNCMVRCIHTGEQVFSWGVNMEPDGTYSAEYQDKTGDKGVKGDIHREIGLPSARAAARLVNEWLLADFHRCTAFDTAADNGLCP